MIQGITFDNLTIDCSDEKRLCEFYHKLLGWEKCEFYGHQALKSPNNQLTFLFIQEEDYIPPVWPEEPGKQQKQIHFDFVMPDVAAAVQYAESIGAVKSKVQFGGEYFVTLFDPDGHPICLCAKGDA